MIRQTANIVTSKQSDLRRFAVILIHFTA